MVTNSTGNVTTNPGLPLTVNNNVPDTPVVKNTLNVDITNENHNTIENVTFSSDAQASTSTMEPSQILTNMPADINSVSSNNVRDFPTPTTDPVPVVTDDSNTKKNSCDSVNLNQSLHLKGRCVVNIIRLSPTDIAKLSSARLPVNPDVNTAVHVPIEDQQQMILQTRITPLKKQPLRKASSSVSYADMDKTSSESDINVKKKLIKKKM